MEKKIEHSALSEKPQGETWIKSDLGYYFDLCSATRFALKYTPEELIELRDLLIKDLIDIGVKTESAVHDDNLLIMTYNFDYCEDKNKGIELTTNLASIKKALSYIDLGVVQGDIGKSIENLVNNLEKITETQIENTEYINKITEIIVDILYTNRNNDNNILLTKQQVKDLGYLYKILS